MIVVNKKEKGGFLYSGIIVKTFNTAQEIRQLSDQRQKKTMQAVKTSQIVPRVSKRKEKSSPLNLKNRKPAREL